MHNSNKILVNWSYTKDKDVKPQKSFIWRKTFLYQVPLFTGGHYFTNTHKNANESLL